MKRLAGILACMLCLLGEASRPAQAVDPVEPQAAALLQPLVAALDTADRLTFLDQVRMLSAGPAGPDAVVAAAVGLAPWLAEDILAAALADLPPKQRAERLVALRGKIAADLPPDGAAPAPPPEGAAVPGRARGVALSAVESPPLDPLPQVPQLLLLFEPLSAPYPPPRFLASGS